VAPGDPQNPSSSRRPEQPQRIVIAARRPAVLANTLSHRLQDMLTHRLKAVPNGVDLHPDVQTRACHAR